jgi:hypothetical protein
MMRSRWRVASAPGHKDDRHRRGCGLGRERRRGIADDQGYLPAKKVRHERRQSILLILGPVFDRDAVAFDVPFFRKAVAECNYARPQLRWRSTVEESDHGHRLLRARRERPRSRAAEQRYELAPPCMTRKEHSEG